MAPQACGGKGRHCSDVMSRGILWLSCATILTRALQDFQNSRAFDSKQKNDRHGAYNVDRRSYRHNGA